MAKLLVKFSRLTDDGPYDNVWLVEETEQELLDLLASPAGMRDQHFELMQTWTQARRDQARAILCAPGYREITPRWPDETWLTQLLREVRADQHPAVREAVEAHWARIARDEPSAAALEAYLLEAFAQLDNGISGGWIDGAEWSLSWWPFMSAYELAIWPIGRSRDEIEDAPPAAIGWQKTDAPPLRSERVWMGATNFDLLGLIAWLQEAGIELESANYTAGRGEEDDHFEFMWPWRGVGVVLHINLAPCTDDSIPALAQDLEESDDDEE